MSIRYVLGKSPPRSAAFDPSARETDHIRFASRRVSRFLSEIYKPLFIDPDGGYTLQPRKFILGQTLERVALPIRAGRPSFAGRIEGRSSFARIGLLVHFTAPTIHAGFSGNIALEMINLANYPITLYPGVEVCQLIIEQLISTPFQNPSEFQNQATPTGPR